ncbi:MAG: MltA domain-containing protein [Rhodocyclaceae bacterium]
MAPAAAVLFIVAGCVTPPPTTVSTAQTSAPQVGGEGAVVLPQAPIPEVPTVAADRAGTFSTKHAVFDPARFEDLPGWNEDSVDEAWQSFRQSCAALARKPAWEQPCGEAAKVDPRDSGALRRFFERTFLPYQIRSTDRNPTGVVTGYFEPLLRGSRSFGKPYVFPIYGVPDDMFYLAARSIAGRPRGAEIYARIVGRNVIPVAAGGAGAGLYRVAIPSDQPDVRDKRYRVRREEDRIVPYYTRAEIERGAMQGAPVLAWADSAAAIYTMQVQGSGRVRLPDGSILRLAYAEQNGHPFLPRGKPAAGRNDQLKAKILTRGGLMLQDSSDEEDEFFATDPLQDLEGNGAEAPRTRGLAAPGSSSAAAKDTDAATSREVERLIEVLSRERVKAAPAAKAKTPPPAAASKPVPTPAAASKAPVSAAAPKPIAGSAESNAAASSRTADIADPSYVFFRAIPASDTGPIGALGVPLTAGRSLAVDPRTTPLGFPVFLETSDSRSRQPRLRRLMMAQDTGGAIRGAVRADFFWGFGPEAGHRAARMKDPGRMWLLLPKGQQVAAQEAVIRTRGIAKAPQDKADCVVPDPDLCVEE